MNRECDVLVAGGGTGGVVAALAAARCGSRTTLIESKGYTGGIAVEGGTALHSFYNLWKAFPGVEKRQLVKGIPQEIIDRLAAIGGTCGHAEMDPGYDYDSVATVIDTELYKLATMQMLEEAGVKMCLNTMLVDAKTDGGVIEKAVCESRSGREEIEARMFIDCTGIGDLAARVGAPHVELNDHPVVNSFGVGGVSLEGYRQFLEGNGALKQLALAPSGPRQGKIVRLDADPGKLPKEYIERAREIGFAQVTTSIHDNYFMFIKINYKMADSPTDRDAVALAELELRKRQYKAIELIREFIPGCQNAFIARTSPTLTIRRARTIECDYDIQLDDILSGRHFDDDIMAYGFHDCAPRLKIANGGDYGIPYRALLAKNMQNLLVTGMMITTAWEAHMSTRNTVSCMGQGQGAGTAAALCARQGIATRDLPATDLREQLLRDNVYLGD